MKTYPNDLAHVQTIAFTALVLFELIRAYFVRAESGVPLLSNPWLLGAVLVSFGLQLAVVYTPIQYLFGTVALSMQDWASIAIVTFVLFMFNIIGLVVQRRFGDIDNSGN